MGVRYQRAVDLVELTGILQTTVTGLSIDEISERFEVSRRTAERMLSALRDRFPDLEPIFRGGRKYWKLPPASRARPLQLPRTLETLSERIVELEAEISMSRHYAEAAQGLTEGILGNSKTGMIVVDASSQVVWANQALGTFLGQEVADLVGRDMRVLIRDRIRSIFADPERFSRTVLATYDDNTYIENFECHVLAEGDREERWLEHWSRPIERGRYAGGRIDHYVDITSRVRADDDYVSHPRPGRVFAREDVRDMPAGRIEGSLPDSSAPVLRQYLATLQEVASAAITSAESSPEMLLRLAQIVQSMSQGIGQFLDVTERGADKPEPLSVPAVLETTLALVRGAADEKGVEVSVVVDPSIPAIRGDRALVVTGVAAATRNSIEALPPGSKIELRADLLTDPDRVRISILDDGPGMPALGGLSLPFSPTRRGGVGMGVTVLRDENGAPRGIAQHYETPTYESAQAKAPDHAPDQA